jgi:integrase
MPTKPKGVYSDGNGGWYFKATAGRDPLTRKRAQLTKRGYRTAAEAGRARREFLEQVRARPVKAGSGALTVDGLLDLYLDGLDADGRLAPKTRFDYRNYADAYIRPLLGAHKVRDVTPETILEWQRRLAKSGGAKKGTALSRNSVRLARAPLAGAFKLAVASGVIPVTPLLAAPRPTRRKSIPRHWAPEQAREFLDAMGGDRTYPLWAFLLSSGLRIGELVWLRWSNVDLERRLVRVVEFASTLGYELVQAPGKSSDAVRTIELDDGLVTILRTQRKVQAEERLASRAYVESEYVFTKRTGGPYHPQYISKLLSKVSQRLGLPRLTAHGLRHTSATLMLANGVPPKVAAERLGHADAMLFTNLYSHVTPTMQRDAADKIGSALFS